jgi:very-short-patch-repair endonuclease
MPRTQKNARIYNYSDELRLNPTDAELRLWKYLRAHRLAGVHFRRQHIIGNFIVDFCAPRQKLVIEVDGGQHLNQVEYDQARTAFFELNGYRVLRFWDNEVLNQTDQVLAMIWEALKKPDIDSPSQIPPKS